MNDTAATFWMRYRDPLRSALFPLRAGWAATNRYGLLPAPRVGSTPHLSARALDFWRRAVARSAVYLEYGAGGSTVEAMRSARHVISVETDRRYLRAVEAKVAALHGGAAFYPVHADIGWTSRWGQPLLTGSTARNMRRWRCYPAAPWHVLERLDLTPDFILVDGRFRVASVLESFVRLPDGSDCLIMLDDFETRPAAYQTVLRFAEAPEILDGAIAIRRKRTFDRTECLARLEEAYADPL